MGNYSKLEVWQRSVNLAVDVYKIMESNSRMRTDFRLRSQLCSSAVSIASNIAEGATMKSDRHGVKYFYIAKGSIAELKTQLIISSRINYLEKKAFKILTAECDILAKMLTNLIKVRQKPDAQSPKPKA